MDTESKEMLREWLVGSLEPVCDADPEVLSKYVLALIQNDPKKEGLRETCVSKLEEFLGDETAPFVSRLFTALETEAYRKNRSQRPDDQQDADRTRTQSNHHHHHQEDRHHQDGSRRRARTGSNDENEDDDRYSKRRRDDERAVSPRRSGVGGAEPRYGGRDGGRGGRGGPGPRGGDRGGPGDWDRRRNFPPEWGMPPPGMWGASPPHLAHGYPHPGRGGGGPGGFQYGPMGGEAFDPNMFNPENHGMMPPPHLMMGGGGRGGPYGPYPPYGGRGRGGRGHFHGGRSIGGRGEDGMQPPMMMGGGGGFDGSLAKTTLRVSNVDPKYVNMTKLSLHFSKFGNVVNVQMRPQHKCAYVQYASEEEAKKAFHSPMPVCNNRFIEVKWAKYDAKDPQGAPSDEADAAETATAAEGETATQGEDSQASGAASAAPVSTSSGEEQSGQPDTESTPEELRAAALEKGRRVLEEKRELLEKQKQLMKQKEELLKRQLAQQKELLERMSQNPASVSAADKRDLLNKITTLSEELKALHPPRRDSDPSKLNGLKAELSALEAAANGGGRGGRGRGGGRSSWAATGTTPPGGYGGAAAGGRGFYRGGRGFAGRGAAGGGAVNGATGRGGGGYASNSLDNRTTIVKVANLPDEARDASVLEQHFGHFGGIARVVVDETSAFVKFADRYAGQAALARGAAFGEARLELSWVETQDAPTAMAAATVPSPTATAAGGEGGGAPETTDATEAPTSA